MPAGGSMFLKREMRVSTRIMYTDQITHRDFCLSTCMNNSLDYHHVKMRDAFWDAMHVVLCGQIMQEHHKARLLCG